MPLIRRNSAAASSIQLPYTRSSITDLPFNDLADAVFRRCGAQTIKMQPDEEILNNLGNKYVVSIALNQVGSPTMSANGKPNSCRPVFHMLNSVLKPWRKWPPLFRII